MCGADADLGDLCERAAPHGRAHLYNVRLLGAAQPQRPQAEQEQQQQDEDHDADHGGVAGLRKRGRVRSLGRDHVGEVQHVAQRPAGVASFNL